MKERVFVPEYMQDLFKLPEFIPLSDAVALVGREFERQGYVCLIRIKNPHHKYYGELRLSYQ